MTKITERDYDRLADRWARENETHDRAWSAYSSACSKFRVKRTFAAGQSYEEASAAVARSQERLNAIEAVLKRAAWDKACMEAACSARARLPYQAPGMIEKGQAFDGLMRKLGAAHLMSALKAA